MPRPPKRKLYITSGDYEDFVLKKRIKRDVDLSKISIELNEAEEELFQLLIDFTKFSSLKTTVRVAGGWVRDKILAFIGRNNTAQDSSDGGGDEQRGVVLKKDIDIALDDISGKEFALGFNQWLQTHRNYPAHGVGIISRDPDKSKHLETATLTWNEISIDFVGLRSETYTLDSRIPIVRIGTAEEDAFRRDFTINSIFYNLNERRIEDLTNNGIEDLYDRVIRTPLDPMKTFLDDPLRALRAFRFTSRLHFRIEEGLMDACRDKALHDALQTKISRERVGSEVHEMISNRRTGNPAIGLRLIVDTGLVDSVFRTPKEGVVISSFINGSECRSFPDLGDWYLQGPYLVELTHRTIEMLASDNPRGSLGSCLFDTQKAEAMRKLLNVDHESNWGVSTYFSFLLPLFHHYFENEKSKEVPLVRYVLSSSLKLSNKVTNSVMQLFDSLLRLVYRVIRIESLNELANLTLRKNPNRDGLRVDIYSREFSSSTGDSLLPEIWTFYREHFKNYLKKKRGSTDQSASDKLLQRRVKLGIFVLLTGSLWLEMLVTLFSLDLIHASRLETSRIGCWSDAQLLDAFASHPYLHLIGEILEANMATLYNFRNPVDGSTIRRHFPQLERGPKYKFIINISLLWFMAFSPHPENPTPAEVASCIEFVKQEFKDVLLEQLSS